MTEVATPEQPRPNQEGVRAPVNDDVLADLEAAYALPARPNLADPNYEPTADDLYRDESERQPGEEALTPYDAFSDDYLRATEASLTDMEATLTTDGDKAMARANLEEVRQELEARERRRAATAEAETPAPEPQAQDDREVEPDPLEKERLLAYQLALLASRKRPRASDLAANMREREAAPERTTWRQLVQAGWDRAREAFHQEVANTREELKAPLRAMARVLGAVGVRGFTGEAEEPQPAPPTRAGRTEAAPETSAEPQANQERAPQPERNWTEITDEELHTAAMKAQERTNYLFTQTESNPYTDGALLHARKVLDEANAELQRRGLTPRRTFPGESISQPEQPKTVPELEPMSDAEMEQKLIEHLHKMSDEQLKKYKSYHEREVMTEAIEAHDTAAVEAAWHKAFLIREEAAARLRANPDADVPRIRNAQLILFNLNGVHNRIPTLDVRELEGWRARAEQAAQAAEAAGDTALQAEKNELIMVLNKIIRHRTAPGLIREGYWGDTNYPENQRLLREYGPTHPTTLAAQARAEERAKAA